MHFEGTFEAKAPVQKVWEFIINPHAISKCIPDLQRLEVEAEDRYLAVVRIGIGFVKGEFKFRLAIVEKQPPSHARLKATGTGPGSSVDLDTSVDLTEADGVTRMAWKADVMVGGIIASLGQRLMGSAAEKSINEIFQCIQKQLERA